MLTTLSECSSVWDHFLSVFYFWGVLLVVCIDCVGLLVIGENVLTIFTALCGVVMLGLSFTQWVRNFLLLLPIIILLQIILPKLQPHHFPIIFHFNFLPNFFIRIVIILNQLIKIFINHINQILTIIQCQSNKLYTIFRTKSLSCITNHICWFLWIIHFYYNHKHITNLRWCDLLNYISYMLVWLVRWCWVN